MTTSIETYEHHGVEVRLYADEDCGNPRADAEMLTTFATYHPSYTIGGSEQDRELPSDGFDSIDCTFCPPEGECERCEDEGVIWDPTPSEWLRDKDAVVAAPLFLLDHSGHAYSTGAWVDLANEIGPDDTRSSGRFAFDGAGWDTSFVGFVYVTLERALELGIPGAYSEITDGAALMEAMVEQGEGEVDEYDSWAQGDCYGYIVAEDTPNEDSCWGFIGIRYAREEANSAAETTAEQIRENAEANSREMAECATAPFVG